MPRRFHHIGLTADMPQPGESWVEKTRVWVTDPDDHPQKIEWLRYAPDSPVSEDFQSRPHIAYTTDSLDEAMAGKPVVLEPMEVGDPPFGRAVFVEEDDVIVEYIEVYQGRRWFDDEVER
jgi:hypothetical protein